MTWDVKQLRMDIVHLYGAAHGRLAAACLESIDERRGFARYHFSEAKRLLSEATAGRNLPAMLMWMLDSQSDEHRSFLWVRYQAAAHITACVQNMHSLADILGHAVYYGLGMNLDVATTIMPRALYAKSVCEKVPDPTIQAELAKLVEHDGFAYLSALCNHSKHRSIVPIPFSVDVSGEDQQPHGLKFGAFEYHGMAYTERWVTPSLTLEYDRQEVQVHAVGHALNAAVATKRQLAG